MGIEWPSHGGQPAMVKKQFHIHNNVIDFSANIHPFGPPNWMKQVLNDSYDRMSHYPDPSYPDATNALAKFCQVDKDEVLVTNGGAEAIFLTAKYFEGGNALIIQPTFSEYERACQHYHLDVQHVYLDKADALRLPLDEIIDQLSWADVVYLCRPNNPTGTVVKETEIRLILDAAKKTGTYLVVDEAFVDFLDEDEDCSDLVSVMQEYHQLILLRSMTKMFAVPGLRVGYMLANKEIIKVAKQAQIPWSVNAIAGAIIPLMLEDQAFVAKSRRFFHAELIRLRERLEGMNYYMSPSSANFYLLRDNENPNATSDLFEFLLHHGILARHTDNFKQLDGDYLRFAIRSESENDLLLDALSAWRRQR
ncbi:threonine-phosphate decarboxylase CobD [Salipaludibacillus sp. HK11]|uniref:threonine-phosphate decarboxylase CobD n=1 Tax=Salipaludibacillus sp. HK11 TaxID=3394320 RepID=UPI0039FBEA54